MIRRTKKPGFMDFYNYFKGEDSQDIWEFEIDHDLYEAVNSWRQGFFLYKNNQLILEEKKLLHLNPRKPLAELESNGRKIKIYLKSFLNNNMRVAVDDKFIQHDFI
ncbi:MAG TPA: hypothetical protein PLF71_04245 [bacterium]|nr:hypothetical protein [bacterium]